MNSFLEKLKFRLNSANMQTVLAFLSIPLIGLLDQVSGQEITLSPFYFVPVALIAWNSSLSVTLAGVLLSTVTWWLADFATPESQHGILILGWNFLLRLIELLAASIALESLKRSFARERALARIDGLTGALNNRAFRKSCKANCIAPNATIIH